MTLGEQITQLRKQKKMSQEDLADAMQISRQAISKWENDQSNPDTENLIRLAAILEVDVNDLIGNQLPEKEAESGQSVKKAHPRVIWLLSILLILSLCTNILLGILWGAARNTQNDAESVPTQPAAATRWDSIILYRGTGLDLNTGLGWNEIELSQEDKRSLSDHIWNGKYTIASEETFKEIIYGGPSALVVFVRGNIEYHWTYYGGRYIHYSIISEDGMWHDYYTLDEAEWNWMKTFLQ